MFHLQLGNQEVFSSAERQTKPGAKYQLFIYLFLLSHRYVVFFPLHLIKYSLTNGVSMTRMT